MADIDNSAAAAPDGHFFEESCEDYLARHRIRQTLERIGVHVVEKALSSEGGGAETSIQMAVLACFEDESFMAEALFWQKASVPVTSSGEFMIPQQISSEMPPLGNPPSSNSTCARRSGCVCRCCMKSLQYREENWAELEMKIKQDLEEIREALEEEGGGELSEKFREAQEWHEKRRARCACENGTIQEVPLYEDFWEAHRGHSIAFRPPVLGSGKRESIGNLKEHLLPLLEEARASLYSHRPSDPVAWLHRWLRARANASGEDDARTQGQKSQEEPSTAAAVEAYQAQNREIESLLAQLSSRCGGTDVELTFPELMRGNLTRIVTTAINESNLDLFYEASCSVVVTLKVAFDSPSLHGDASLKSSALHRLIWSDCG